MIKCKIIRSPGKSCQRIVRTRVGELEEDTYGAIGLVQGMVYEIIYAADIAEKAASVSVYDIRGNCPQTFTTIAILGDIENVETALRAIKQKIELGDIDD